MKISAISDSESFISQPSVRQRKLFYDTMSPVGRRSRLAISRPMDNIFKVIELDVNGERETKYVINSEKPQDISSVSNMIVTKIKNFDQCRQMKTLIYSTFVNLASVMSHFPEIRETSRNALKVLKLIRAIPSSSSTPKKPKSMLAPRTWVLVRKLTYGSCGLN